MIEEDDDLGY